MKKNKIISWFLITALALGLAGCAGQGSSESNPSGDSASQSGSYSETGTLAKGETAVLSAVTLGDDITWTSSDPARVTVDENGTVTALMGRGTVTITASCNGEEQSWDIPLYEQTEYGAVSLEYCDEDLTIGVWNGAFHWFDEAYMKLMEDAGIDLIIGVKDMWIWEGDGAPMLDLAEQYGITFIADLRGWDGETVPAYAEHPALEGFLLYDEPSSTQFEYLTALKENFEAIMPDDVMFYVNLFPEACSYESLFGDDYDSWCVDYEEYYLNYFMDTVDPACISYDAYALQEGNLIRSSYYHNFDVAAHRAKEDGVPFWYTLCASGHWTTDGRYVTPTARELRWQMLLGMTYGANTLNHYVLTSPTEGDDNMLEYATWQPTKVYDEVKKTNLEFLAWDDIYMSYDWVGTAKLDTGNENLMLTQLEYDLPFTETGCLTGVESDQDLLIGVFEKDGENAYMITNAADTTLSEQWMRMNYTMTDATVELQLADGDYQCAAVIINGEITYVPVSENNTVSITVGAFNGAFVIPVMQ